EQCRAVRGSTRRDADLEVGAVEADLDVIFVGDLEATPHVGCDRRRGRGGEREDTPDAELARDASDLEVIRPEVVPPLGDAVRLVDGEERNLERPEPIHEPLARETLGSDVEDAKRTRSELIVDPRHLARSEAAV